MSKVLLPVLAVTGRLPHRLDLAAVLRDGPDESLREVEWREVGDVAKQRHRAAVQAHLVEAHDAA